MDFRDLYFGKLVDTSDAYIKVSIVHPTVYFVFFVYAIYQNIAIYLYGVGNISLIDTLRLDTTRNHVT